METPKASDNEKLFRAVNDLREALANEIALRKEEDAKLRELVANTMIAIVKNTNEFLGIVKDEHELAKIIVDRDHRFTWWPFAVGISLFIGTIALVGLIFHLDAPWHKETGHMLDTIVKEQSRLRYDIDKISVTLGDHR